MSFDRHANVLRIELLGGFRISYGNDEIRDDGWRLAKARSLVKIIALAPDHSILREQLIELLWPELDPDSGSNNLHQALHVARRTLGSLISDAKPNEILRLRRGVLSLEPPVPVWVDVLTFEEQVQSLSASRDPSDFYNALELYRGDLLPDDLYEDWVFERRMAAREQYLALLDRLATLHIARKEAMPAIDALRRIVAIEPDLEEAHRSLMELYALTGRRQQALRQYERLRDILERELDLEPEPESDELHEAILSGEFPTETWDVEPADAPPQAARAEISESIADFLQRVGDFVGRSDELVTLQQALERVIGGRGEIILVAGEAGIGKTRMTEEFLRYANAQGVRTLWGRCYEGDGAPAYWPWVQIVRSFIESRSTAELRSVMGPGAADIARIAPEVRNHIHDLENPPQLDPDGERFRLFDSMTSFLKNAAGRAPLALIIDDLHTADRSSLLLLEFLAREIAETGLLIIGTYRHVEVDRSHPLTHTLGQLARQDITERITLEGLKPADIDRFIELITGRSAPPGLAEAIQEQTEGNSFFVREIVHLLIDEERLDNPDDVRSWRLTIPPGIRETIALRTASLSETAHKILTTASVSGRDFELPIVAQVAGLDEMDTLDGLEEALRSGLVIESSVSSGGFRFSHAITRETLYEELSDARRLRLHLRTGSSIESLSSEVEGHVPDLAYHFSAALPVGSPEKAVEYLVRAGRQSRQRVAHAEAARYLTRAIAAYVQHIGSSDEQHCDLLLQLGEAHNSAGDSTDAQDAFEQAADIARALGDARRLAQAAIGIFEAGYYSAYSYHQFIAVLEEGLQFLPEIEDSLQVRILSRIATALQEVPDESDRMRCISDRAVQLAQQNGNDADLPFALYAQLLAHWSRDNPERTLDDATALAEVSAAAGDVRMELMGHAWRTFFFVQAGNFEAADQAIEAYGNIARRSRQFQYEWAYRLRLTMRKLMTGPLSEAERAIDDALTVGLRTWPEPAIANHFQQLFYLRRLQGRSAELIEQAQSLIDSYPDIVLWQAMMANLHIDLGHTAEAERRVDRIFADGLDAIPDDYFWLATVALTAEACARLEHRECYVGELVETLEPYADRFVSPGANAVCLGPASHYLSLLAHAQGNTKRADEFGDIAVDECRRCNHTTFGAWLKTYSATLQ